MISSISYAPQPQRVFGKINQIPKQKNPKKTCSFGSLKLATKAIIAIYTAGLAGFGFYQYDQFKDRRNAPEEIQKMKEFCLGKGMPEELLTPEMLKKDSTPSFVNSKGETLIACFETNNDYCSKRQIELISQNGKSSIIKAAKLTSGFRLQR